jgi:hypothetical protein
MQALAHLMSHLEETADSKIVMGNLLLAENDTV